VWAVGAAGIALRGDGAGKWAPQAVGVFTQLNAVAAQGSDLYLAGGVGTLVHSTGGPFTADTIGSVVGLTGLTLAGNAVIAVGGAQTVLRGQ
jgi:hypothetical protein